MSESFGFWDLVLTFWILGLMVAFGFCTVNQHVRLDMGFASRLFGFVISPTTLDLLSSNHSIFSIFSSFDHSEFPLI
ncbi:Uncharacterized protein TCM_039550 [Theobroma cacao]|uniref:Uncharacterized protein n=1 Tax=Theobroma cacao TaxID=3641 RepID=A0A061GRC9_THECC|nr:Uncharacterized protein TCM_039550 [Theobroma cacao]